MQDLRAAIEKAIPGSRVLLINAEHMAGFGLKYTPQGVVSEQKSKVHISIRFCDSSPDLRPHLDQVKDMALKVALGFEPYATLKSSQIWRASEATPEMRFVFNGYIEVPE